MTISPIRTWRRRRREAREARSLIAQINDCKSNVDRCSFVTRESTVEAQTCQKMLRKTLRELEKVVASNKNGDLVPVPRDAFLNNTRACKDLLKKEFELQDSIHVTLELLESLLQQAGVIPLDQARSLQAQLSAVRYDLQRLHRRSFDRSYFVDRFKFVEKSRHSLRELHSLILNSATVATKREAVSQLPLRASQEIRQKQERLTSYAAAVQKARNTGDARSLRESWRRFNYLADDLKEKSENSVKRAVREIQMWRSFPELSPALFSSFDDRLMRLVLKANSRNFLEEWSALKREMGQRVNDGFEAHWGEVTKRFRKIGDFDKLSWKQLKSAANQVRKEAMPPIYRD